MTKKIAVWGTGSLAERFLENSDLDLQDITCFIDRDNGGDFKGKPVVSVTDAIQLDVTDLIICSTYIDDILPRCFEAGYAQERIAIVLPRTLAKTKLNEFTRLDNDKYYFLPWLQLEDVLSTSLSNDIVFPDVYKELTKSIAYTFVASVEGDFAEFGTCSGYSASLIANVIQYYSSSLSEHEKMHGSEERKLHLFDSFQGFPKSTLAPDIKSPHVDSGAWGEGTAKGLDSAQLKSLCSRFLGKERINIYEGWYKDTLGTISNKTSFAFVHLDCDLYESTFDVLNHLLSKGLLSEGAVLMFDNWFCNRASKDFGEQKAWHDIKEKFDIEYTNVGMYACVGNKLIIHSYRQRS